MAQGGKIKPHVLCLQDDHVVGRPGHGQDVIVVAVRYGATTKHRLAAFEQVNYFIQTYFRHGTDLLCRFCSTLSLAELYSGWLVSRCQADRAVVRSHYGC